MDCCLPLAKVGGDDVLNRLGDVVSVIERRVQKRGTLGDSHDTHRFVGSEKISYSVPSFSLPLLRK